MNSANNRKTYLEYIFLPSIFPTDFLHLISTERTVDINRALGSMLWVFSLYNKYGSKNLELLEKTTMNDECTI